MFPDAGREPQILAGAEAPHWLQSKGRARHNRRVASERQDRPLPTRRYVHLVGGQLHAGVASLAQPQRRQARDLRQKLARTSYPPAPESDKRPGQVTRLVRRLHAHGLVARIPHSRRWRLSLAGRHTMTTAIKLREVA